MRGSGLERAPLDALLDGMAMDLEGAGIADESMLHLYCSRVASAVGRACLPVLGARGPAAVAFADHLGQALQLTNIRRDLRADADVGRVYVPRTWLAELGVDLAALRSGDRSASAPPGVARLCERLETAAAAEFALARRHLLSLPRADRRALVPARIMGAVYGALLRRLRAQNGALGAGRVRVPRPEKLWLAFRVWVGADS
jgi:phytoene synthase